MVERGRRHTGVIVGSLAGALVAMLVATPLARSRVEALRDVPARTYVSDGNVEAIATTANAVYIGGSFTYVGVRTGPGVGIDALTGRTAGFSELVGAAQAVYAVATDGTGGFYIGGSFTRVGGLAIANLAHIRADRSIDAGF